MASEKARPASIRIGLLTALTVAAILAVSIAGVWEIASARSDVFERGAAIFRAQTSVRARELESTLATTRADLAFLASSPPLVGLARARPVVRSPSARSPDTGSSARTAAEGALLLFLRGHREIVELDVRAADGALLVAAGRRGGVPVVWRPAEEGVDAPDRGTDARPLQGPLTGSFPVDPSTARGFAAKRLEATIDATGLLSEAGSSPEVVRECTLLDSAGTALVRQTWQGGTTAGPGGVSLAGVDESELFTAQARIDADGWSSPAPWTLDCRQFRGMTATMIEPLANRYRLTMAVNLGVMMLAVLLGALAIQQARRKERLVAKAREEARVRELERQLFHTERLGTVGRLAAGIAHEINNPLEGISNYLGLARDAMDRRDDVSVRRHLENARTGVERAAGVVQQVLAHAEPARAPKAPLDVLAVLRRSVDFVRSRDEFRGIAFHVHTIETAPPLDGNEATLGQVFLNLLINACEAQPDGGEVNVSARLVGSRLHVAIADRGPGVTPEQAARIFEPFYSTKGTSGLGLSICYTIVRDHAGTIEVAARPGGGTVFVITFPVRGTTDA